MEININEAERVSKRFAYVYKNSGHPIVQANQLLEEKRDLLKCKLIDKEWQCRINENWWGSGYTKPFDTREHAQIDLVTHIREFGGYEVCMPYYEEDLHKLLSRGQFWYGDRSQIKKGAPSQCHRNTCNLWKANRETHELAIATGYALSKDGMWRQHTWLMIRKPRSISIIETTVKRLAYYGFVMTEKEALEFCDSNY